MCLSMERFWKWKIFAFLGSALDMSIREKITKADQKETPEDWKISGRKAGSVIYKIELSEEQVVCTSFTTVTDFCTDTK